LTFRFSVRQDDGDEYTFQEDEEDYDDQFEEDDFLNFRTDRPNGSSSRLASGSTGRRRSTRTSALNANGKRDAPDEWSQWRGERRSTRLGAPPDTQLDVVPGKRARTEESTISTNSAVSSGPSHAGSNGIIKAKVSGAAAVKPTETAVEQIAGKKKSKFWFYAVEPIPGSGPAVGSSTSSLSNDVGMNGHKRNGDGGANGQHIGRYDSSMDYDQSLDSDGSLSPVPSIDS
jgi:hypothetical protein